MLTTLVEIDTQTVKVTYKTAGTGDPVLVVAPTTSSGANHEEMTTLRILSDLSSYRQKRKVHIRFFNSFHPEFASGKMYEESD